MVYGVDQCRICGAPIIPRGPEVWAEQEAANRRPILPEKEWRRRGFLTSPTRIQLQADPANGCCRPCGIKMIQSTYRYHRRGLFILGFAAALAAFILVVVTYLAH
jgi:hypothetical protein